MSNVVIREVEARDIPEIKEAINTVWPWSELIEGEDALNATIGLYLNQVLYEATFGRVAVLDDKVVGVIFGSVEGKEPQYRTLMEDGASHALTLLGASERDRICCHEYLTKIKVVYEKLLGDNQSSFDGTLDFLILTESAQGLGIGKKLWLSLKSYFEKNNITAIYLYTDEDCNFGFYEHQGFIKGGEEVAVFNFGGHIYKAGTFLYEYHFN